MNKLLLVGLLIAATVTVAMIVRSGDAPEKPKKDDDVNFV
jgi:hypothetical protein